MVRSFKDFLLIPELTAKENVLIALDLAGKKGEEFENKAISLLKLVGLEERIDHFPTFIPRATTKSCLGKSFSK